MKFGAFSIPIVFSLCCFIGHSFANAGDDRCLRVLRRASPAFTSHIIRSNQRNQNFVDFVSQPIPKNMLFFHAENAVLKSLNDRILGDKAESAELQDLFSMIFFENLARSQMDPPVAIYTDYKSIRLGFSNDSPILRTQLAELHRKATTEFESAVLKRTDMAQKLSKESALVAHPSRWNRAGLGTTPDTAGNSSRFSRYRPTDSGVHHFDSSVVQREMHFRFLSAMAQAKELNIQFGKLTDLPRQFLVSHGERSYLTPDAIDLFHRVKATTKSEYDASIQEKFQRRFGVRLTEVQIRRLQSYVHLLETFSPSIYETQDTKDLGISTANHGIIAIDLAGQNVRNLVAVQKALYTSLENYEGAESLPTLLDNIRKEQDQASTQFEQTRAKILTALINVNIPSEIRFSGDDVILSPKRPLTENERKAFLPVIHAVTGGGATRITMTESHYLKEGTPIPAKERGHILSEGENLEKSLRDSLERSGVPIAELRKYSFAVTVQSNESVPPTFKLQIFPQPPKLLEAQIRGALVH